MNWNFGIAVRLRTTAVEDAYTTPLTTWIWPAGHDRIEIGCITGANWCLVLAHLEAGQRDRVHGAFIPFSHIVMVPHLERSGRDIHEDDACRALRGLGSLGSCVPGTVTSSIRLRPRRPPWTCPFS